MTHPLHTLLAGGSETFRRLNPDICGQTGRPEGVTAAPAPRPTTIASASPEDRLNKTERAYLAFTRAAHPERVDIGIQNVRVQIGFNCRFTPDLTWWEGEQFVLCDVKGAHAWEDSRIKIKAAAHQYPRWRWIIAHKDGAGWREELIRP
jgi:hypothetical protein